MYKEAQLERSRQRSKKSNSSRIGVDCIISISIELASGLDVFGIQNPYPGDSGSGFSSLR